MAVACNWRFAVWLGEYGAQMSAAATQPITEVVQEKLAVLEEAKLERAKKARNATLRSGQARHALYACRPH